MEEIEKNSNQEQKLDVLRLTINGQLYTWAHQYISGLQIRKLGGILEEEQIFLAIKKPWENELVNNDTQIDLARPQIEHFFTEAKLSIIVNGRVKIWNDRIITFEQLVDLAFGGYDNNPDKVYTVTYDGGPERNPEGSMVKGQEVFVTNKMIFNVTATDKS